MRSGLLYHVIRWNVRLLDPAFWLVASDSPLSLSAHRPDVSISWVLPQALASSGILLSRGIRLAPTL